MKLKLPDDISSMQDLTALILEFHEYGRWLSHMAIKQRVDAKHVADTPNISPAATELLHSWGAKKSLDQQDLDELVTMLEKAKATASTLTITLSAPPTNDIKKTLVTWCRQNIAPNVLVTFQFNRTLLGGMVVRYGSRIFDWSFRRQILAARDRFPEVLRNV
jgi:hypothetical protein